MFKGSGIIRFQGYKGEQSRGAGQRNKRKRPQLRRRVSAKYSAPRQDPDFRGYDRENY